MTRILALLALVNLHSPMHAQEQISVMSFNIRYDNEKDGDNRWQLRKERVAAFLAFHEPDFIGAQEVLHRQLTYLDSSLTHHRAIGVGRDDGRTEGEYACILYDERKFVPVRTATFWLSETPDRISRGWDAAINRICTYGLFRSVATGRQCWVLNTHFDHMGPVARRESAKLMLATVDRLKREVDVPVILMGDFNARPEQEPVRILSSGLLNARDVSRDPPHGGPDTWNGFKFAEKPDGWIDHIFVSGRLQVLKYATCTDSYEMRYLSDHFPILARISLLQ